LSLLIDRDIRERIRRLDIPFNACGVDPYGISREYLARFYTMLGFLYRTYFRVKAHGLENVPSRGRAMLVGNHSGGIAVDGLMVIASAFFEKEPPRLCQGMAEKFMNQVPFFSQWTNRTGQFTGIPELAARLLEDERLLMVFPEGARGTAKLYKHRYSLVGFGTGFIRLALQTRTPIIPFGFIGGGDAIPTVMNSYSLGKMLGAPYVPITPYGVAVPLPVPLQVYYGEPMVFSGTGSEDDEVICGYVDQVKARIAALIEIGRSARRGSRSEPRIFGRLGAGTPHRGEQS
jgi:1-acyl-sn-glycerol-3-phosphate acyltransferase